MKKRLLYVMANRRIKVFLLSLSLLVTIVGITVTVALFTDVTKVLANKFEVADLHTHIDEKVNNKAGTIILKQPVITNDGSATAFIRARITVSPDYWNSEMTGLKLMYGNWSQDDIFTQTGLLGQQENTLYSNKTNTGWFYKDGWYYYNQPVKDGFSTTTLFDAVDIGSDVNENFDITIYQEAVASKAYLEDENSVLDYEDITNVIKNQGDIKDENIGKSVIVAFEDVNKNN